MDSIIFAKLASVSAAFVCAGYSFSFSQSTVPLIYNTPASISTKVFSGVFYGGAAVVAPGAIISSTAYGYLAYQQPHRRQLYITAAVLILAPLVWTRVVMNAGIQRLLEISQSAAKQQTADQSGEVVKLLKQWTMQNWMRAGLSFSAGMVGLWAQYAA